MTLGLPLLYRNMLRMVGAAGAAAGLVLGLSPAAARTDIAPYLEVQQVLEADLNGGEVLTYTALAAGIDARVSTRRVEAQISYRYEHRIDWQDEIANEDVHSGLAQARIELARDLLSLDAGAIAVRSRVDGRAAGLGFSAADNDSVAQVYGVYGGPTLSTHAGPVAVNAAYRLGYVHIDDESLAGGGFPGALADRYESAVTHSANASVGMGPGRLPAGWTVAVGYQREDGERLDQRFEGKYVRGDIVVPVTPTLAVTAGVGYEKLEASQQDVVRSSNGVPILSPGGKLVADPSKPRLLAYDQSGLIWDAGVIWRPNSRTELQARVGERYGSTTVTASLEYRLNDRFGVSAFVYDNVTSFGRSVINDTSELPMGSKIDHRGINRGIGGGCIFGGDPGTGGCLDDSFQSLASANFRNRGAGVLLSGGRGPWDYQLGLGYAHRKYLSARDGDFFSIDGVVDRSLTLHGGIGRELTRTSGIDFDAYASWFDSGVVGDGDVLNSGVTATYYRSFLLERLQGQASVGLYHTDADEADSTVASALLGLRYQF